MVGEIVYPPGCQHVEPSSNTPHLLKELKALADKLQCLESEGASYTSLASHLLQSAFIRHNAKEVKVLVACCLADVLRLSAPNICVESDNDLKELFSFFIRVLRSIEDVNNSNYKRYFYLLECLGSSNSFLSLTRLECSETVITLTGKLFNLFFHVIKEEHAGKVRSLMLDVMTCLLNEPVCVNNEILDLIYQQMLPPFKHQRPCAYSLASDLLRLSANNIENHVLTFFNEVFTKNEDIQMLNAKSSGNGHKLTLHRIYELLAEVYSSAPSTILAVLPQLEMRLKSPDVEERVLAVQCVGKMFGQEDITFIINLWSKFASRARDVSAKVRTAFLESVPDIMIHHQEELGFDIRTSVFSLSRDLDEKVRSKVVSVVDQLSRKCFSSVVDELLEAIKGRMRDANWAVRSAAMKCAATMYNMHCNKDTYELGSKLWSKSAAFVKLSWVPDRVLQNYMSTSSDEKLLVEKLFCTKLITSSSVCNTESDSNSDAELKISTSKLVHVFCQIEEKSVRIVQEIFKTGVLSQKYDFTSQDVDTLTRNVVTFVKRPTESSLNNNYYSFDKVNSDGSDVESSNEDSTDPQLAFLSGNQSEKIRAVILVETVAFCYPKLFDNKSHFEALFKLLNASVISEHLRLIVLKVFTALSKNEHFSEISDDLSDKCERICLKTENSKVGKYCAILLNIIWNDSEKHKPLFASLFKKLTSGIDLKQPNLLGALGTLAQIGFIAACDLYKEFQTFVYDFLMFKLLSFRDESSHDDLPSSLKDLDKEEYKSSCRIILAKVAALKLINRWLLGLNGVSAKVTESKFKMLHSIIANNGDMADEDVETSELEKNMMKLTAFRMMLKLNIVPLYRDLMTEEQFHTMASVILDPNKEIRELVAAKLEKNLSYGRVPLKFLAIFSFSARDPDDSLRLKHQRFIKRIVQKRRQMSKEKLKATPDKSTVPLSKSLWELNADNVMPYVIHLLAHFHEFDSVENLRILQALKECLWYMMEVLMSDSEHFLYTYHKFMLDALKLSKDALDPESEEATHKLYAVCDLAMTLLNSRVKVFDTTPSSELKLVLPPKLFVQPDLSKGPNNKVYIDASLLEKPKTMIDSSGSRKNKRKDNQISLKEMTNKPSKAKKAKLSAPKSQSKISDHVITSFSSASKKRRFVEPDDNDDTSASFSPSIRRDSPDLKPQKTYPSRRSSAAATAKISMQQKSQVEYDDDDDEDENNDSSDDENRFVITRKAEDVLSDFDRSPSVGSPKLSSTGKKESPHDVLKKTHVTVKTPLANLSLKNGGDSGNHGSITSGVTSILESSKAKRKLVMKSATKREQSSQKSPALTNMLRKPVSGQENKEIRSNAPKASKPVEISSSPSSSMTTPKKWNLRTSGVAPEVAENDYLVERSRATTSSSAKQTTLGIAKQRQVENKNQATPGKTETTGTKRSIVRIASSESSRRPAVLGGEKLQTLMRKAAEVDTAKKKEAQSPQRPQRSKKDSQVIDNDCILLSSATSTGSSVAPKRSNKTPVKGKKRISETETISESSVKSSESSNQRSTRSRPRTASSENSQSGSLKDQSSGRTSLRSQVTSKSKLEAVSPKAPSSKLPSKVKKDSRSAKSDVISTPKTAKMTRGRQAKILDTSSVDTSPSVRSVSSTGGTPCSRTRSRVTGVK